jgi:mono/diheme cytochrome c family protein
MRAVSFYYTMRPWFNLIAAFPLAAAAADFERDIRPLLQRHCVECHGPEKQKGDLRLDAKTLALKGGHDGPAFVAGEPGKSPLFQRITSTDEEERMPAKADPLSAAEIALVKSWIDAGAAWPESEADRAATADPRRDHWSVQPVRTEFTPGASIDTFVAARLKENGLAMSPAADRRTLIRRLSFDLHGLPPTPERVERFIADRDPRAYEKLVDELLASPHYGERWARHWLDIAHYADTHGFERDQLRPHAWRYRDYVIAALNADKPYAEFLREQIAGDVIAPGEPAALIATGFLAAGPWDFVGHVETRSDMLRRAARAGDLDDIVTQVITSTMGVTIHCARCHDHKLDPVSQRDYYSLWSVFAGVKRDNREVDPAESKRLRAEKERLQQQHARVQSEVLRLSGGVLDLADMVGGGNGHGTGKKGSGLRLETGEWETAKLGFHRNVKPNRLAPNRISLPETNASRFVKGVFLPNGGEAGQAKLTIAPGIVLKDIPPTSGLAWDIVRFGLLNAQAHARINGVDYAAAGHSILGLHANAAVVFDLSAIREANGVGDLRLTAAVGFGTREGAAASKADFAIYLDGERALHRVGLSKTESLLVDLPVPATAKFLTLMATDGGDGIGSDLLFLGDARLRAEVGAETLAAADRARIDELKAEVETLQQVIQAVAEPPQVFAIKTEDPPPVTRVQRRGNPDDEGAEVAPGSFSWVRHAPAEFGDNSMPEGARRRALADWITHPANPLTPRVLVNRLWHHHFGQGIVATPSDFGLGGSAPSHPALLDWLAGEFLRSGGSLKHVHRLIVTSATYRQQSRASNPAAMRLDAQNRLLWRQNPRRLDAESLRDTVLAVAGTLNPAMGGPGYRDFKYTEAYAPLYDYITPDEPALWRRSIYRFIVRTTPHQFMSTLDCADPANVTPVRVQTTTALQALTLANNEFMLLQARYLAARVEREAPGPDDAVRRAFALAFQRPATAAEVRAARTLAEREGLFAVCRALLNANEFIHVD